MAVMQVSIYYKEEDRHLIDMVEKLAARERMRKSAMVLSILEEYFESTKKIGQILKEMQVVNNAQLNEALSIQKNKEPDKQLGEILVEGNYINEKQLQRALKLQTKETQTNTSGPTGPKKQTVQTSREVKNVN